MYTTCSERVTDVYVGVKTHLCNVHTCPCTSAQNTCPKVHATLTAKKCTYMYIYTHMHTHTYAHEHTCACMTPSTRWSTDTETHNLCTNMHTHTHTHVYKRIDVHIHTHMHIYIYVHVRTHTHIHIYTHTHTKCTYVRTQARLERRRSSKRARSWCRRREPCTSLSFDAIKPLLAPPMLGLHCTHFLKHQYHSTPHPLFPTYPRTVRGPRASTILLFHTDQMHIVHSSEEAPRSFTMAPCVVVERLEGKQRCSRAPVDEHAKLQAREWPKWLFTGKRKVNEEQLNPTKAHHAITTARRQDNTRSSALVRILSTQFMARPSCELTSRCSGIGFTFSPFSLRFLLMWPCFSRQTVSAHLRPLALSEQPTPCWLHLAYFG